MSPLPSRIGRVAGPSWIWLVLAASAINAGLFSYAACGALVQADGWYFLDSFVREYLDGGLSWRSFFLNRGGSDHVQVLQKAVLLSHLRLFDLDFKVEGLIGWAFGVAGAATLVAIHLRSVEPARRNAAFFAATAATAAVYLSLNSPNIYTWSLVTLGFAGLWFFLLTCACAWRLYATGRGAAALFAASTLTSLASDNFALLAIAAVAAAVLLQAANPRTLGRCARVVAVLAAPAAVMQVLVHLPGIRPVPQEPPFDPARLLELFLSGTHPWREVILVPLSSSLVHGWQLATLPPWRVHLETALGLSLAAVHVAFWWTLLVHRRRAGLAAVVSSALVLVSYGSTAGIVLTRVAEFGPDYVGQPRYVMLEALAAVGCLLWFSALATLPRAEYAGARPLAPSPRRGLSATLLAAALVIIALQVPISIRSWALPKYVAQYQQRAALQMGALLADPARVPERCLDILVVCGLPEAKRANLMHLLGDHQLNLFSPRFQRSWGLRPYPTPPA
jgi:hypothetical protein